MYIGLIFVVINFYSFEFESCTFFPSSSKHNLNIELSLIKFKQLKTLLVDEFVTYLQTQLETPFSSFYIRSH